MEQKAPSQEKGKGNIRNSRTPSKSKTSIDEELQKLLASHKTVIKVFGVGGAGNNTVTRLNQVGVDGVETFAINTDAQDLLFAQADHKVLIGRDITNGLGAGSDPTIGEKSALENEDEIRQLMEKTDLAFITCGLGGGTGTGAAPILAKLGREAGSLTISIVTLPFSEEGVLRWKNARTGLETLHKNSDTLIVIQNDKLWEVFPDISLDEAFKIADEILVNGVKGITELVTMKGLVNLDFADIRTIMKDGGIALIGMGESDSPDRSRDAVEKAIENPLIDLDINGASNALLNIVGGKDMSIKDAKVSMQTLAQKLDKSAKIIWGARINPELENRVRVMVIATGLKGQAAEKLFQDKIKTWTTEISPFSVPSEKSTKSGEEIDSLESDISLSDASQIEDEAVSTSEEKKEEAKKIFREIMQEEADTDLKGFQDCLEELKKKIDDEPTWQALQNSCAALMGTAHMFDFFDIAEISGKLEELIQQIREKKFFVEELLVHLEKFPPNIRQLIDGGEAAIEWGKDFKQKVQNLSNFLKDRKVVSQEAFVAEIGKIWESKKLGEDQMNSSPPENEDSLRQNEKNESISSVHDVVKYVDHLLKGDGKSKKL